MKQLLKLIIITLALTPALAFSQTNKSYIRIGYSSICCGTPSDKPLMDFVKNFEKENKLKPFEMFIEQGLGKEGEHAFYLGTDNLSSQLLQLFWDGLKTTASKQNEQRSKNKDGYVNVADKLIPNSTLKNIKIKPSTPISSLAIYNYKK
jgi:hypothetical protein